MWTKPTTSNAACWFAFLGMASFAIGALSAGQREGAGKPQPPKKADALPALLKVRLDAAKKNDGELSKAMTQVKLMQGRLFFALAKPEEVYTWSVRWLNAERDMSDKKEDQIAALESHLRRMKELQEKLDKMVPPLSPVDATAAAWYVAEAEVWLAKAQ